MHDFFCYPQLVRCFDMDIRTPTHTNDYRSAPRPYFNIAYVEAGDGLYRSGGREFRLQASDILFIPRGGTYLSEWKPAPRMWAMQFETALPDGVSYPVQRVPSLPGDREDFMEAAARREIDFSVLERFYRIMGRTWHRLAREERPKRDPRIGEAAAYIEAHCAGPLTVREIARAVSLSESHLYELFRQNMGVSPIEYKQRALVAEAERRLTGSPTKWGAWRASGSSGRGDWGIAERNAFCQWILEEYGTVEAATQVYGMNGLSPDCLPILPPEKRESHSQMSLWELFYQDAPGMRDYHEFLSGKTVEALEHFGRIVHELTDKPVGAFYGYLVVPQAAYAGHLAIERILCSTDIDFLCSPRAYQYAGPGEPGGEQAPSRSYNRKKLWLDELDNWTHLDKRGRPGTAKTLEESLEVLEREVAKNITGNQGFWWMDLYDGWFDHPAIMEKIRELKQRADEAHSQPHESVSEVLMVMDESSIASMRVSYGLTEGFLKRMEREVRLCGAPVDLFRLKDLTDLPLHQYKVVVFLNAFYLPDDLWGQIKPRLPRGVTLIWHYAAGICHPHFEEENIEKLTGFAIERAEKHSKHIYQDIPLDFPPLRIAENPTVYPLLEDEGIVAAQRRRKDGGISVLAAEPCLETPLLRELLAQSGVMFYADAPCAVYADNRVVWSTKRGFEGEK